MDVQLSDGMSFDLFKQYRLKCPVIFTTAFDEYAVRAFKVNGVDYLLKPVDGDELKKAIDKARSSVDKKSSSAVDLEELVRSLANPQGGSRYKERFLVSLRHQWVPVHTRDIACFVKENPNYFVLFDGTRYQLDNSTLDEVEEVIGPGVFYRANRQFIIHAMPYKA